MKRSHSDAATSAVDSTTDVADDNFDDIVRKVSNDCLSIVGDMCLFYKAKGRNLGSDTDSCSVVSSLLGDIISGIPEKFENSLAIGNRDKIIQNLSSYVLDLEDDKSKKILEIEGKNTIIEKLSSYVIDLEIGKSKAENEISSRKDAIEKLSSYADDLANDNFKLLEGIENLHKSHGEHIDNIVDEIETSMGGVILDERKSYSSTIQNLYYDLEGSRTEFDKLSSKYEHLSRDYGDFQDKAKKNLEYQELGYLSRISSLEDTIFDKDSEIKALKSEIVKLNEDIRLKRTQLAATEKEKFKSNQNPDSTKGTEIVKILDRKMKAITVRPPPILNQVCFELIEPAYHNHGIVLKNFKVDYQEGIIMGIDDIKTSPKTDDICKDCGRSISFDPTNTFRYHRGVISDLRGVPKGFGYLHSRCVNSIKYTNLVLSRVSVNEQ